MWKKLKSFFAKFFSHDQSPIGMVPDSTTDTITVTLEAEYDAIDILGKAEVVEVLPEVSLSFEKKLTKNFSLEEFSCNDKNKTPVPKKYFKNVSELADNLQILRVELGKPIKVISGYRTLAHNTKVGGVKTSQHMKAKAGDLKVKGLSPRKVADKIKKLIEEGKMKKGGVGLYKTFVHYDTRGVNRRWYGSGVKK